MQNIAPRYLHFPLVPVLSSNLPLPPGSGESGKSTIVKQMKIIHQDGFSNAELADFRPIIYRNVVDSAQDVVRYMRKVGLEFVEYNNRVSQHHTSPAFLYSTLFRSFPTRLSTMFSSPQTTLISLLIWPRPFISCGRIPSL